MYTLEATYRVVTPLFAGGADQKNLVELRPTAFKGMLRFWYRAVALPLCNDNRYKQVREQEKQLFGSTAGQASFGLKIKTIDPPGAPVPAGTPWVPQGSAYLGYGVVGWNNTSKQVETSRPYLKEGFRFVANLAFPGQKAGSEDIDGLKRALIALGLFGGLGSRSRKGFGSIALESMKENGKEIWTAPQNIGELKARINELFQDINLEDEEPEYSAFSGRSRVAVWAPPNHDALKLLDAVGREMVRYRSYGQSRGKKRVILGKETPAQIFRDDHDLIWDVLQGNERPTGHPRRVVFGLPHNYFFFSTRQKVDVNAVESQRRASPLFIHIHQLTGGCAAVFTLLPARFLPDGDNIKMSVPGRNLNPEPVAPQVDYQVIHDFIDRFPGREEVLP